MTYRITQLDADMLKERFPIELALIQGDLYVYLEKDKSYTEFESWVLQMRQVKELVDAESTN